MHKFLWFIGSTTCVRFVEWCWVNLHGQNKIKHMLEGLNLKLQCIHGDIYLNYVLIQEQKGYQNSLHFVIYVVANLSFIFLVCCPWADQRCPITKLHRRMTRCSRDSPSTQIVRPNRVCGSFIYVCKHSSLSYLVTRHEVIYQTL